MKAIEQGSIQEKDYFRYVNPIAIMQVKVGKRLEPRKSVREIRRHFSQCKLIRSWTRLLARGIEMKEECEKHYKELSVLYTTKFVSLFVVLLSSDLYF